MPLKYVGGVTACLDPLKCHILSPKTVVGQLYKPHNMKDERLVSKMEGKTNFSRQLKQFDGVARLTPTHDYTTDLCCCTDTRSISISSDDLVLYEVGGVRQITSK